MVKGSGSSLASCSFGSVASQYVRSPTLSTRRVCQHGESDGMQPQSPGSLLRTPCPQRDSSGKALRGAWLYPPGTPVPPLANAARYERQRVSHSLTKPTKSRKVRWQSPSCRTFRTFRTLRTLRTAVDELLQLLDQLFDAFKRTTLVNRHPNLLKALNAPWVS